MQTSGTGGGDGTFLKSFRQGATPRSLADETNGQHLLEAILKNDPGAFREALAKHCPELVGQARLYGIFVLGPQGIMPVMVDENGARMGDGFTFDPAVPIHLLNVEITSTEMRARIGDEVYVAPLSASEISPNHAS
jgi:hypothetical protein